MLTEYDKIPATIYALGAFGVDKIECKLLAAGTAPYAQHPGAARVDYIPAGKRKMHRIIRSGNPCIVVLRGHGHPDPADPFSAPESNGDGFTCTRTRYASFAPEYRTEWESAMAEYLAAHAAEVLMDARTA